MVGQPLGQNVNSALIPTAAGVNPIGGFRYKTPKLTSPARGTLGGSPTTPPQNNAPNQSNSSKALRNVPQYPWKNPFLQNVQTAITAKKSPPRHAQNINIRQQPLYNPFQNYTAGLWNTQQLALHSPPPKHLKASEYNLPSSCDVIAKSDLEDICNSMQMPTILGSGSFGEVRLMRQLSTRRVCAVKVHHKNRDEKSIIKDLQKETSMLTSLSHLDCIPKLFGISRIGSDTDVPVLVQEFVGDSVTFKSTTVADVIDAKGLNGPSSFSVAIQVCCAMKDIHFAGMIHCDLKTDNIMFLRGPSGKTGT
ncbi:protein kinase [Apostichopus japonicus]|uniref:mitogen-activated protein kinase kinase n=1 Tax=Stichopus japonicus TaxID=307972 RepID=A0A2G8JS25_STIJA|nr:protein kinase [Apostichopus japonicus]